MGCPCWIDRRGFTLVELLLVLVILGILASLVLPKFTGRTEQARVTAAPGRVASAVYGVSSAVRSSNGVAASVAPRVLF